MSTMTLEQKILAIPTREEFLGGQYYKYVRLEEVLATIDAHLAQPAQATTCAGCGEHKATPLRIDAMGGYVCLTCIDQKLSSLLGEFGYPESQSAQAADVGAIREVAASIDLRAETYLDPQAKAWANTLARALTGEKAGPVDGWQPIETAPKDETVVLTYSRRTGIDQARFISGVWAETDRNLICEPTHWQPLHASPAPDKEGQS